MLFQTNFFQVCSVPKCHFEFSFTHLHYLEKHILVQKHLRNQFYFMKLSLIADVLTFNKVTIRTSSLFNKLINDILKRSFLQTYTISGSSLGFLINGRKLVIKMKIAPIKCEK